MYRRAFRTDGYEPSIMGHKRGAASHNDLVLEDDVEDGETIVGEGKASLLGKEAENNTRLYVGQTVTSGGRLKSRNRGMCGPITSNLDERDKHKVIRARSGRGGSRPVPTDTGFSLDQYSSNQDSSGFLTNTHKSSYNAIKNQRLKLSDNDNERTDSTGRDRKIFEDMSSTDSRVPSSGTDKKSFEGILSSESQVSSSKSSRRQKSLDEDLADYEYGVSHSSIQASKEKTTQGKNSSNSDKKDIRDLLTGGSSKKSMLMVDDLELGDVDDFEDGLNNLDIGGRMPVRQPSFVVDTKPIDIKTAVALKTLVLGSAQQLFNDEWRYQSFTFCDLPRLQYGIVQKKGGACGLLASVQACLLQQMLYAEGHKPSIKDLEPSRQKRSDMLAAALTAIFWRAGDGSKAIVTLPGMRAHFPSSSRIKGDNLIETLMVNTFTNKQDMHNFLQQNINQFELDGSSGVILSLYSAILSRTIEGVRSDMDEPTGKLMGAHYYCTQDMVNLFLTGHAASNVFNDIVELDGGDEKTVLKGIQGRSDIGLLSLFEHYKSCQVGTYMKTPKRPIWVVCSESHFSVLFSLQRELLNDWKAERRFDLYYYDGLAKQDAEIRLTIDTTNRFFKAPSDDDLVPPLEQCIRTKWGDAEIDWNDTDPLL